MIRLLLFSIFFLVSCLQVQPKPTSNFVSSNNESIVFGKFLVFDNGTEQTSEKHRLFIFPLKSPSVDPYVDRNSTLYRKQVDMQDGHFFFTLPPGKYGLNHIHYFKKVGSQYSEDTISPLSYLNPISDKRLVFFEVLPNQANYIGTIKVEIKCCYYRECKTNEKPFIRFYFVPIDDNDPDIKPFTEYYCSPATYRVDDISIADDSEQSFLVFQDQYSNHPKPITSMANSSIKQTIKPSDKGYKYFEISEEILKKFRIYLQSN